MPVLGVTSGRSRARPAAEPGGLRAGPCRAGRSKRGGGSSGGAGPARCQAGPGSAGRFRRSEPVGAGPSCWIPCPVGAGWCRSVPFGSVPSRLVPFGPGRFRSVPRAVRYCPLAVLAAGRRLRALLRDRRCHP